MREHKERERDDKVRQGLGEQGGLKVRDGGLERDVGRERGKEQGEELGEELGGGRERGKGQGEEL